MTDKKEEWRMWGGRFKDRVDEDILNYTIKMDIEGLKGADYHLFKYEILANYAHILMLVKQGIIEKKDAKKMLSVLQKLGESNNINLEGYEDVHSFIEDRLLKVVGLTPHICRSRNDQVILLERLYMREEILDIGLKLIMLINSLLKRSVEYEEKVIPAYTHWRQADVTSMGHLLRSYAQMLTRDLKALHNLYNLINTNPLGASAASGCSLPIDREYTSMLLGFSGVQVNILDVVTNRWEYQARYLFTLLMIMKHLSTISRDIIFLSTDEMGIVEIEDCFATGSSALPHKKNPDPMEIIIGRTKVLEGFLTTVSGLGGDLSGYHREGQEGKWLMIKASEDTRWSIDILRRIVETLQIKEEDISKNIRKYIVLPEIANQIAFRCRISFRKVHKIVGRWVSNTVGDNYDLHRLVEVFREEGIDIPNDVLKTLYDMMSPLNILHMKSSLGMPGDTMEVKRLKKEVDSLTRTHEHLRKEHDNAIEILKEKVNALVNND